MRGNAPERRAIPSMGYLHIDGMTFNTNWKVQYVRHETSIAYKGSD